MYIHYSFCSYKKYSFNLILTPSVTIHSSTPP